MRAHAHTHTQATLRLLDRLIYSVEFESFLATKYNTTKRFGLEGVGKAGGV